MIIYTRLNIYINNVQDSSHCSCLFNNNNKWIKYLFSV